MIERDLNLKPTSMEEVATLLLKNPHQFVRNVTLDPNKGRSLYGEILSLRGVSDEVLLRLSEEEANKLAFKKVNFMTAYRRTLVNYTWRHSAETKPELLANRVAACLINPKLLLGKNTEVIITLGEMANTFTNTRYPTVPSINWQGSEAEKGYAKVAGQSYVTESHFMLGWYARNPVKEVYAKFGEEMAKVAGYTANELQLLPDFPLNPQGETNAVRIILGEIVTVFAENLKQLYFIHKFILPGGRPLSPFDLLHATNERLKRQGIDIHIEGPDLKVFEH